MRILEPEDRSGLLVGAFEHLTGARPTVLAHAPGRVNLMGEHTDYNAGLVLPVALPHRTRVAVRAREDGRVTVQSLQRDGGFAGTLADCGPGGPDGWTGYAAGVLWALSREGLPVAGVDLVVDSTVPVGAGLSSSAALECAVGAAVLGLLDRPVRGTDADLLIEAAVAAEREVVGAPTGGMDQMASMHGRAGRLVFLDTRGDTAQGAELATAVRAVTALPAVVALTHAHFDHCFGTAAFPGAPVYAQAGCAGALLATPLQTGNDENTEAAVWLSLVMALLLPTQKCLKFKSRQ